ncbi:MAG: polysaccharide pyruvyl transferase family protein [Thermodesulfobacteriota bacterium]
MPGSTIAKTVGVITYHYFHNYGAVLQAYALCSVIAQLGHSCQIIDFCPEPNFSRQIAFSLNPRRWPGVLVRMWFSQDNSLYRKRFDAFIANHLPLTEHCYTTAKELEQNPPLFDTYVCGSDQVWHPLLLNREFGLPFLLSFVPEGKRRVSYAASFGVSEIPEQYRQKMADLLCRFDAISVREDVGCSIVKSLTGKDAKHVVDPTFLLTPEDYQQIAVAPPYSDFVLVYPMETGLNQSFVRLVELVKSKIKLPFVFVFPDGYSNIWLRLADKVRLDAGPKEFVGLIDRARLVLTNSFHGTALSIILGRPFLGVPHSSTNARIRSLLQVLNLQARQLVDFNEIDDRFLDISDYSVAFELLSKWIEFSLDFLRSEL